MFLWCRYTLVEGKRRTSERLYFEYVKRVTGNSREASNGAGGSVL